MYDYVRQSLAVPVNYVWCIPWIRHDWRRRLSYNGRQVQASFGTGVTMYYSTTCLKRRGSQERKFLFHYTGILSSRGSPTPEAQWETSTSTTCSSSMFQKFRLTLIHWQWKIMSKVTGSRECALTTAEWKIRWRCLNKFSACDLSLLGTNISSVMIRTNFSNISNVYSISNTSINLHTVFTSISSA